MQLVGLVISRMNAKLVVNYESCDPNVENLNCFHRQLDDKYCKFHFGRWILWDVELGVYVLPMQEVVAVVPRGMPLNVFELLRAPYCSVTWKVISSLGILGLVIAQVIFQRSAVNLLLLVVCELGESLLVRMKPVEKVVTLGVIVLVYLLLSAYEAKIVSFLADWPYQPDLRLIEDIEAMRVQLLANYYLPQSVVDDPRLNGLITRTNLSVMEELFMIPQNVGFLSLYETARIILQKQLNIDRRTGRAHFVMLEERLSSELTFFYFGRRNVLRPRFALLQQRVYESGFDQHWIRTFAAQHSFRPVVDEPPKMIRFEQLQELKVVFMYLWMISLMVFLMELIYFWFPNLSR